ncbi:hypothetical protein B0H21DRAFT_575454 [Amylocystis lapponica]|nr:hypothetical protein B0H21DRAFT_575454 [Amylocystis lapponica]
MRQHCQPVRVKKMYNPRCSVPTTMFTDLSSVPEDSASIIRALGGHLSAVHLSAPVPYLPCPPSCPNSDHSTSPGSPSHPRPSLPGSSSTAHATKSPPPRRSPVSSVTSPSPRARTPSPCALPQAARQVRAAACVSRPTRTGRPLPHVLDLSADARVPPPPAAALGPVAPRDALATAQSVRVQVRRRGGRGLRRRHFRRGFRAPGGGRWVDVDRRRIPLTSGVQALSSSMPLPTASERLQVQIGMLVCQWE